MYFTTENYLVYCINQKIQSAKKKDTSKGTVIRDGV